MLMRIAFVTALLVALVLAPRAEAGPFPTWDKQISGPGRFKVLRQFADAAVLDKETGLVWRRSPVGGAATWATAMQLCQSSDLGGRAGWRLPTIEELMSLVDRSRSPALPDGHPFEDVLVGEDDTYWSSTTAAGDATLAFGTNFGSGAFVAAAKAFIEPRPWCVRGGQGHDGAP